MNFLHLGLLVVGQVQVWPVRLVLLRWGCLGLRRFLGGAGCESQGRRSASYQHASDKQHAIPKCFRIHCNCLLGTRVPLDFLTYMKPGSARNVADIEGMSMPFL